MTESMLQEFSSPGSPYRGKPLWSWNGRLVPEELRRQIRMMHRMGMGGFFMHSRNGLDTAYLSDEWFDCVRDCVEEAKKLKMEAWIYDEDRFPSGHAGGKATIDRKNSMRHLVVDQLDNPKELEWDGDILAAFIARREGTVVEVFRQLQKNDSKVRISEGQSILVFKVVLPPETSWCNGETYLDTMNPEAVNNFIQITHDAYRGRFGDDFGKTIPGVFTDEPSYGWAVERLNRGCNVVPWTGRLPSVFKERYGYDLIPHLPELFWNKKSEEISRVRYHYRDCITHLFVDAFSRQIGQWCEQSGVVFSGHILHEDTLSKQTQTVGSCMRFYEHMQAPGMDLLTEYWRIYDTAKQVSSVARQFNRKWRLTELYACTGWDFPFNGHKALGDFQLALGINMRCQHLSWYTMKGEAKRDYPATISYQSPWWQLYPKVEDYFARIHSVMTRGEEVRDILVIHPVESVWTLYRGSEIGHDNPKLNALDEMLMELRDSLLKANLDFDYGDEEMLSRHGKLSKRKDGVLRFCLGEAVYRVVIVPPQLTIRQTTLDLLRKFNKAGGTVVFAGEVPGYVDALPSEKARDVAALCTQVPGTGAELARAVEAAGRRVSITDGHGEQIAPALHLLREDRDAFYLFVCNTGHTEEQLKPEMVDSVRVRNRTAEFPAVMIRGLGECDGAPLELDPGSGEIFAARASRKAKQWGVHTSLPVLGSRLFVFPKKKSKQTFSQRPEWVEVRKRTLKPDRWDVLLSEPNVLVLDRPSYRLEGGKWRASDEILRVDQKVRGRLGIQQRNEGMNQPWTKPSAEDPKKIYVDLEYTFEVFRVPGGELALAIENPETFEVYLNGTAVDMSAENGWWCDRSLKKVPLDVNRFEKGLNTIRMHCRYTEEHSGLEIVYLLGSFGATVRGTQVKMTVLPDSLEIGDWTRQGLPFYSGAVTYCRKIQPKLEEGQRLFLRVPDYRGAAVRILVDNRLAGIIAWEPNEIDITDQLPEGAAELRIEVVSHRRNSHGPHHLKDRNPIWTGPAQYRPTGKDWTDNYQLVPCGLLAEPVLVVRERIK